MVGSRGDTKAEVTSETFVTISFTYLAGDSAGHEVVSISGGNRGVKPVIPGPSTPPFSIDEEDGRDGDHRKENGELGIGGAEGSWCPIPAEPSLFSALKIVPDSEHLSDHHFLYVLPVGRICTAPG